MYLTEIPELSANCMYSVVNVYMISYVSIQRFEFNLCAKLEVH